MRGGWNDPWKETGISGIWSSDFSDGGRQELEGKGSDGGRQELEGKGGYGIGLDNGHGEGSGIMKVGTDCVSLEVAT